MSLCVDDLKLRCNDEDITEVIRMFIIRLYVKQSMWCKE